MIVPNRNPRELLMAKNQIEICSICANSLAIVVKCIYLSIWKWNPSNAVPPTVISVLVLVNIITKMDHIIDTVFSCRISVCIEEPKCYDQISKALVISCSEGFN